VDDAALKRSRRSRDRAGRSGAAKSWRTALASRSPRIERSDYYFPLSLGDLADLCDRVVVGADRDERRGSRNFPEGAILLALTDDIGRRASLSMDWQRFGGAALKPAALQLRLHAGARRGVPLLTDLQG